MMMHVRARRKREESSGPSYPTQKRTKRMAEGHRPPVWRGTFENLKYKRAVSIVGLLLMFL